MTYTSAGASHRVAGASYRVVDEPVPGRMAGWIVDPIWPLLTMMLGSSLAGWIWFAVNAAALGGSTRRREHALLALSAALTCICVAGLIYAEAAELIRMAHVHYLAIVLPVIKLSAGYAVLLLQQRSFALYSYFGGQGKNGIAPMIVAAVASHGFLDRLDTFWRLVFL